MTNPSVPITERRYILPLALVTSLFFLWAIGVNLNDILIPHLKKAFSLTDFRSSLIQTAFFGGYFLAAWPAGRIMEWVGYKKGILLGLLICATGALLFIPAAMVRWYGFFLFALFIMACGQCFLEVAANPYVTVLGPPASSERRLNLAQSFNSVGAVLTPIFGAAFILSGVEYSRAQLAAMSAAQREAYRISEANMVKVPYLIITAVFLLTAVLIYMAHLPEIPEPAGTADGGATSLPPARTADGREGARAPALGNQATYPGPGRAYPHLVRGVIAQFFYVGAQVGVASFVIRFVQYTMRGTPEKMAANYLKLHLLGFMLGRFAGSAIMKRVRAPKLLSIFAAGALASIVIANAGSGIAPVWAVVWLGFFHSIMFPTIFALSLKNLGAYTKRGSSWLVMSIIGGAIIPAVMGYISDASNIQRAFLVPLICYIYVFYFAAQGYKPAVPASARLGGAVANIEGQ